MTRAHTRGAQARRAAAIAAALLLSTGCATKHDLRDLRLDLQALSARQDSLLRLLARQNTVTQDTLRSQTDRLFEIRGDVSRQLTRILDELSQLRELTGQNQRTIAAIRDEMDGLRRGAVAAAPTGQSESVLGVQPGGGATGDPAAMYAAAFDQYQRDQLTTAQRAFQAFVDEYPSHERVPDARYNLADILEQQEKFKEAADAFNQIPSLFPTSSRAPDALYRIALLDLDHLNKKDEARRMLERVVNSYPDSNSAGPARQKLREIR